VLPPALALLIATWWSALPINFDTLYEVHLFSLLPILAAWMVATWKDDSWHRGTALAILAGATVLVRNELIVAFMIFGTACLVGEVAELRSNTQGGTNALFGRLAAYGAPMLVAVGICSFFYWRSIYKYPEIFEVLEPKHTVNMCQVYAVGYQQRYTDWNLHPWLECSDLMQKKFGEPFPGLFKMITANPHAALEHFLWNLSLVPNGLQVSLFNAMSGMANPDYPPVVRTRGALVASIAVVAIVVAALLHALRHWAAVWRDWLLQRTGTWLVMLAVVCVAVPIVLIERPRPSYLFPVSVFLMMVIGSSIHILTLRRSVLMKRTAVVVFLLVLLGIPPYYFIRQSTRPLYANYERLQPFTQLMVSKGSKILLGDYNGELRNYLGLSRVPIETLDYRILLSWQRERGLTQFLDENGIDVFFVQPRIFNDLRNAPQARELLSNPESVGWQRVAPAADHEADWILLFRQRKTVSDRRPLLR
jgi:hypothetical protein